MTNAVSEAAARRCGPNWTRHKDIVSHLDPYWDDQLRKTRTRIKRNGAPATSDRIISGISFGFWTHLMTVRFVPLIWRAGVRKHFPFAPSSATVSSLQAELDRLSEYRNRIAHHKSLYDRAPAQLLTDITRFIGYRCPATALYAEATCSLEDLLSAPPCPADLS